MGFNLKRPRVSGNSIATNESLLVASVIGFSSILFSLLPDQALAASGKTASGESLYQLCAQCHGENGEGNKSILTPAIAGMPAWYVKAQLHKFRNGARGKHPKDFVGMKMRPMARTLSSDAEIDVVSDFVSKMAEPKLDVTVEGNLVNGEEKYVVCVACHGKDGKGNKLLNAPALVKTNDWYLLRQLQNFKSGIRGANSSLDATGASMRPMSMTLDDQSMKDVVAYIQRLR